MRSTLDAIEKLSHNTQPAKMSHQRKKTMDEEQKTLTSSKLKSRHNTVSKIKSDSSQVDEPKSTYIDQVEEMME